MDKKQYVLTAILCMFASLVGGGAVSWLFMGTPVFAQKTEVVEVIRAERFEVVDKDGQGRAALGLFLGEPYLSFRDKNGQERAELGLNNGEPGLGLGDKNGKIRAVLYLEDGEPGLWLNDKNGNLRAELSLDKGEPDLSLYDKNDKLRAALGHIALEHKKTGETRQRPVGSLVLFGKDGKSIWQAP